MKIKVSDKIPPERPKKKRSKASKGSQWERDVARMLSQWWTKDDEEVRDDIFWRTGGSGGMATRRSQKGKTTSGQYGDIMATDPIGAPLIKALTIELKRGYSKANPLDVVDCGDKTPLVAGWIEQAKKAHQDSKSLSWIIIVKRDRREPFVILPDVYAIPVCVAPAHHTGHFLIEKVCKASFHFDGGHHGIVPLNLYLSLLDRKAIRDGVV